MAWQDRLNEAAYTPPSGTRIVFQFEDLRASVELRGSRFDFANAEGTYVQATGSSGREFPMRVLFSGEDHDTQAAAFLAAVREAGGALLEHPIAGRVTVVPLGRVSQRNDMVNAANESAFDVTFWETIGAIYPTDQTDPAGEVLASVDEYMAAASDFFDKAVSTVTGGELAGLTNSIKAVTSKVKKYLQPIANTIESIESEFTDIADSINDGINVLIGQPLTLAFQVIQLAHAPARAAALWQDKIAAYGSLAADLVGEGAKTPTVDNTAYNQFNSEDLAASSSVTGSIISAVNTDFTTQPEAIAAAQTILEILDSVNTWREANFSTLDKTDTGEAYQQMQKAASLCAGYLIQISFTLYQERVVVADRARTIVDMCAELYNSVSNEQLDFFINSNAFTGDEILEIPRGRAVKYYI